MPPKEIASHLVQKEMAVFYTNSYLLQESTAKVIIAEAWK
jgi:hypothetical protein